MRPSLALLVALAVAAALPLAVGRAADHDGPAAAPAQLPPVTAHHTSPGLADAGRVPVHGVFEVTFAQAKDYGGQHNFDDVAIEVGFSGPAGQAVTVGGFYYATLPDGTSLWKARVAPDAVGRWTYRYTFTHTPSGWSQGGTGAFDAVKGRDAGFLAVNPASPTQFLTADGQPFWPHGFNDCLGVNERMQVDGGDRFGAFAGTTAAEVVLATYGRAGFNMFRFSQTNCSPDLANGDLTQYDPAVGAYFDWLIQRLRGNGFRVFYGLLGYRLADNPPTPLPPALERFLRYSVNRWGAYVDVWELENERQASAEWIDAAGRVVRAADPYHHPLTTSWERPELASVEINAPHWYQAESELSSDTETASRAANWRQAGKPVVVGEQGNSTPQGEQYGNWLPDSAVRMRLRSWTAFFSGIHLLYWNNSWATNGSGGGAANQYIGPDERQAAQALRWFAGAVDRPGLAIRPSSEIGGLDKKKMRGYLVRSTQALGLYLHNYVDHSGFVYGEHVSLDVPAAGTGVWLDPASGAVLNTVAVTAGANNLIVPTFQVDIAFAATGATPFLAPPIALIKAANPQAADNDDLDADGQPDRGPKGRPFGVPPLTLTLDGRGSSSPNGTNLSFHWSFGDGNPDSEQPVVEHTFADGNWVTTLTVTDAAGGAASATILVRAVADAHPDQNDPPTLDPIADRTVRVGELVLVSPIASDRELTGGSYHVDGHTPDPTTFEASGLPNGATFSPYKGSGQPQLWWIPALGQAGTYDVTFTAADSAGARSAPRTVHIVVLPAPATGGPSVTPTAPPTATATPRPTPRPVLLPYAEKPEPAAPTPPPTLTPPDEPGGTVPPSARPAAGDEYNVRPARHLWATAKETR
jgi:hypothetical protein